MERKKRGQVWRESVALIAQKLRQNGAITTHQFELITAIIRVCNAVVHGQKGTIKQAGEILDIATVLVDQYVEWLSWGFQDGWRHGNKK